MKEKQKKLKLSDYIKGLLDAYKETQIEIALIGFYQSEWREMKGENENV